MYSLKLLHVRIVRTGSRRHFNFVYRHKSIRLPWPGLAMSSSQIYSSQVKSSHKSQKLAIGVRLESTINAVIEGIHVHRSVKLFLVLLRGLRGAPAKFVHGMYPACESPRYVPRKILAGTHGVPYPPRSLLAGPCSVLAGVWNYLWLVL